MNRPEDLPFARWCRTADPAALGELFDATAPRLLRVAIHLVGDAAEAEDLVQQVFLAAIEQRARLDGARPVWPWLTAVLANLARKHHRRSARTRALESVVATAEDPGRQLERRELDGEVARAIDALSEPYREVVLLRLRHALEPADIAHVLGRDAGTVRVQLHRGLEKLRATLPAGLATGLALLVLAPRGLAAVRSQIVARAGAAATVGSTSLLLGGGLVLKQLLVAALVVLGLVGFWLLRRAQPEPSFAVARAESALAQVAPSVARPSVTPRASDAAAREPRAEPVPDSSPAGAALPAVARVVDAETGEPLAGVELALYRPRTADVHELLADTHELYELGAQGEVRPRGGNDWPLVLEPSAAARFGRAPVTVFDRPRAGEAPLVRARSERDGTFELPLGDEDAVLEGSAAGYATRCRPVRAGERFALLELWRAREVHGRVLVRGLAPEQPIGLVLTGSRWVPPEPSFGAPNAEGAPLLGQQGRMEGLGAWTTITALDGTFTARVGAAQVAVAPLTSGYAQCLVPGFDATEEIRLWLELAPTFHFLDAADGAPVETVRLLARELDIDFPRWTGEFPAPGGILALPQALGFLLSSTSSFELQAWSEGYAPAQLALPRLGEPGVHEVPLERGSSAVLEGNILRAGAPLAGAEVALIAYRKIAWQASEDALVDACLTAEDGAFHLSAPPGSYLLRARTDGEPFLERVSFSEPYAGEVERPRAGREPYFEAVSLPIEHALTIDLARGARLDVELVDASGGAVSDYQVVLGGSDGRQEWHETDARGALSFPQLPAGHYRLSLPPNGKRTSFSGGIQRELELQGDEHARVRIELDPPGERHGRLAARGARDFTGWRARLDSGDWREVSFDGALPFPLDPGHYALEVLAPDERHWVLSLPADLADGHVFELERGTLSYAGELLRSDGRPWAGVAVLAALFGGRGERHRIVDVTDANGRFGLGGLGETRPVLEFQTNLERTFDDSFGNGLEGYRFEPESAPSAGGTWLSLRAPADDSMRIHGTLRDARGEALPDILLFLDGQTLALGGCWHVRGKSGSTRTDSRGGFDLRLPAAPSVLLRAWSNRVLVLEREFAVSGEELTLELQAP